MDVVDAQRPSERSVNPVWSRTRLVVAIALALALVASLVWLVSGLVDRRNQTPDAQGSRDKVMLAAREYMVAAWNFGAGDLDSEESLTAYRDRVTPLITTSFNTDFDKASTLLEKAVAKEKYSREATVERTAVESLDDDAATVLVGGAATERVSGEQEVVTPYVWTIDLVKVDGAWLVNDFTEYGAKK